MLDAPSRTAEAFAPLPALDDPLAFNGWWQDAVRRWVPLDDLLAALEAEGSHVALARAGMVCGLNPEHSERARRLLGRALPSPDPPVRLLALYRLADLETRLGTLGDKGPTRGAAIAAPALEALLDEVRAQTTGSPLLVEVELRLRLSLAEARYALGQYERASAEAGLAVALGDGLGLTELACLARLQQGMLAVHLGRGSEAMGAFEDVTTREDISRDYRSNARLLIALTFAERGDDDAALAALDATDPGGWPRGLLEAQRHALLAQAGRGGQDYRDFREHLRSETAATARCYQLLMRHDGRPEPRDLEELRREADGLRAHSETSAWLRVQQGFFRSLASLRLGELGPAAELYRRDVSGSLRDVPAGFLALRALALGLALEVGLTYGARDVLPLAPTARELASLLDDVPEGARRGLAERLLVWLPRAAAFLAYSPLAVPELLTVAGPAVMNLNQKPIGVHGTNRLRPIHGARFTLEAFGHRYERRDGGGQLEDERAALLRRHGERLHWFAAVPPALLVYQFVRAHEAEAGAGRLEGTPWLEAARSLARSHGLVPESRGFGEAELERLGPALRALLAGDLSAVGFRRAVGP